MTNTKLPTFLLLVALGILPAATFASTAPLNPARAINNTTRTVTSTVKAVQNAIKATTGGGGKPAPAVSPSASTASAAPMAASTSAPAALVADPYDRLITAADFSAYDHATVTHIQQALATIYHDHPDWIRDVNSGKKPLTDGRLGPITLFWMQRYCVNFKIETESDFASQLPGNMTNMAAFAQTHPAEKTILISNEFARWNNELPEPQRSADFAIRRQGVSSDLLGLVRLYLQSSAPHLSPPSEAQDSLTLYSYSLTADDMIKLQTKDQLMQALGKLQDQPFNDSVSLQTAVKTALSELPGMYPLVWPVVESNIDRRISYKITDDALVTLDKAGVSTATLDALTPLKVNKATDQATFLAQITAALAGASKTAIASEADGLPEQDSSTLRLVQQSAEQSNELLLSKDSLARIKSNLPREATQLTIPPAIAKLLTGLQNIDYPDLDLLHQAARARLGWGVGACAGDDASYNKYVTGLRLSDSDFEKLKADLLAEAVGDSHLLHLVDDDFNQFEQLRGDNQRCNDSQRNSYHTALADIYSELVEPAIGALAQKKYPYQYTHPVSWSDTGCGCVLDDLTDTVYGFYPYWKVNGKPQPINFSVLSRVAYYGLTFDEVGELQQANNTGDNSVVDDTSADGNAFIRMARRHNTMVDWVVQKDDWQGAWASYTNAHKAAVLDHLATNITLFLSSKLTDPWSKAKPYISLGGSGQPTRGDGVTLYFKNYPTDADSMVLFNNFFHVLKQRLTAISEHYFVNILVSKNALGGSEGVFSYANLLKLSRDNGSASATETLPETALPETEIRHLMHTYILVLIPEPTTDAKKQLREEVENSLHGEDRRDMLRTLLPVLVFDNSNWVQLQDDLIYFNDQFGGVGFWPLSSETPPDPSGSCVDEKSIGLCLMQNFEEQGSSGKPPSAAETLVCVHRWQFRLAFDISLLLLVLMLGLYFRFCAIRSRVAAYFPLCLALFGLPPIILFTLLLLFDPALAALSRGNLPFIIAVGVLIIGAFGTFTYMRGRREVPSRAVLKTLVNKK